MKGRWLLKIAKVVTLVVAGVGLFGLVVERLWNWLMPGVFGWKPISFVQALGLLVLSKILLGGLHLGRGRRGWSRSGRERWARMSPEERERFRAGMRNRACRWDRARATAPQETAK